MKIQIEIELHPNEVPLATELLNTLRSLTEHVRVTSTSNGPSSAAVAQVPPQQLQQRAPTPAAAAAPPAAASVTLPPPASATAALAPAAALAAAFSSVPLPRGASRPMFEALLAQLADASQLERVYAELMQLLQDPARLASGPEEMLEAFEAVALNPQLLASNQSVVPFMALLPRLPDPYKSKTRDGLIAKVLQHLTKKRPINVDRTQFFVHAEAFAMLVKVDFVSVDGAAQTIEKLLNKGDSRSAAVTMLGKTVEMCSDKLLSKCNPGILHNLWKSLEKVTEDTFKYDIDYIFDSMGWPAAQGGAASAGAPAAGPAAAALAAAPAATPHKLTAVASLQGHSQTIFSMCYDPSRRQLISGGKDGHVIVWSDQGAVTQRIDMPHHYVCSMDIQPRNNLLLVCGVSNELAATPAPPCIAVFDTNRNWQSRGMLSKPSSTLISCLRCMGADSDGFVTGETSQGALGMQELVCYYDLARSQSVQGLTPVHSYTEHESLVTCVAVHPTNSNIFVSGSRDATIKAWDRRTDRSIGMFGSVADVAGTGTFKIAAHGDMITCLDAADHLLLSTGVDGYLCAWDFRQLSSAAQQACGPITRLQIDSSACLKVALTGAPYPNVAAVSTHQGGLFLVDLTSISSPQSVGAAPFSDGRPVKPYHDIKWGAGQSLLYAVSADPSIDVFALTPST